MRTKKKERKMFFPGEIKSVELVLSAGENYGYGNMIAHLKKAWAEMLIEKYYNENQTLRDLQIGLIRYIRE